MSQLLADKIASVRRKHALFAALRGACAMLGVAVLLLAGGMLLDWYVEFPWRGGGAGFAFFLDIFAYNFFDVVGAPGDWGAEGGETGPTWEGERPGIST